MLGLLLPQLEGDGNNPDQIHRAVGQVLQRGQGKTTERLDRPPRVPRSTFHVPGSFDVNTTTYVTQKQPTESGWRAGTGAPESIELHQRGAAEEPEFKGYKSEPAKQH